MKYQLVIFDFDGTLADSFPFFIHVFNHLAERHHFTKIDPLHVPAFRHYTAREMMRIVGLSGWKLPFVARNFIALMKQNTASIPLFEHVDDMLLHLANRGVTLAIVSSNSYDNVSRILGPENMKLIRYVECGMSIFGKPARLRKVLKRSAIPSSGAIYIGDHGTDGEAAHAESIAFGAVSWGYGTIESLREHLPVEEFDSIIDIKKIALHSRNNYG